MKNWPFPRQQRPGPVLGVFAAAAAVILLPIVLLLCSFFGIIVWAFWTDGSMGKAAAVFMTVGLSVILTAIFTVIRRP